MMWRVVGLEARDAFFNMAIDQIVMEGIRNGTSEPTVRFYTWAPGAVSIGRFQSLLEEVNIDNCKSLGIDFVRRITGGGAVYHDSMGEITYSVIARENDLSTGVTETYKLISQWIIAGLGNLGIKAEFAPINDITVCGKKVSGNAQTRKSGVVLQHGTVLYDLNIQKMFSLLNISKEKVSDKMIKSAEERVTCIKNSSSATIGQLYSALLDSFTQGKDFYMGRWTRQELDGAKELSSNVYSSDAWNFSR